MWLTAFPEEAFIWIEVDMSQLSRLTEQKGVRVDDVNLSIVDVSTFAVIRHTQQHVSSIIYCGCVVFGVQ